MTERYSEEEALAAVAPLTRTQLVSFVQAEFIQPLHTETGPIYRRVDLVRMELLCELSEHFNVDDDALGIIISLIDQLHDVRGELRAVLEAIETEPAEVRARLGKTLLRLRGNA
jgi:chaperone modulatory protein CbpM